MSGLFLAVLASGLISWATWLWFPTVRRLPVERTVGGSSGSSINPYLACAVAAIALWVLLGGWLGSIAAAVLLLVGPRILSRFESRGDRQRRLALQRQAPAFLELLAAVLASGAGLQSSLRVVADAIGDPMQSAVRKVHLALELGADPVDAWRSLQSEPALAGLAEAGMRSATSGAPLSAVLQGLAVDLRRRHRAQSQVAARTAGVRAVAPLAACFLPAFLLLGVVPVIASLAGQLLSTG
jgi:Flp pilus assembly protein TadB